MGRTRRPIRASWRSRQGADSRVVGGEERRGRGGGNYDRDSSDGDRDSGDSDEDPSDGDGDSSDGDENRGDGDGVSGPVPNPYEIPSSTNDGVQDPVIDPLNLGEPGDGARRTSYGSIPMAE